MKDNFKLFLPVDIVKSTDTQGEEMRIAGYASTNFEDREGDEIIQKGLDISEFLKYGWFNFDHDNSKILGYPDPDKCKVNSKGLYVEGTLLKGVKIAEDLWNTAVALKKSGASRKLGFSIEGVVEKKNKLGQIIKAKIYNIAITANPVNPTCTFEALCKSMTSDITTQKALDTTSGSPLIREDLESSLKNLSYAIGSDEQSKTTKSEIRHILDSKRDSITPKEQILYLQLVKGLSYEDAQKLVSNVEN